VTVIPVVNFVLACMTPFLVCGAWEVVHRLWQRSERRHAQHLTIR